MEAWRLGGRHDITPSFLSNEKWEHALALKVHSLLSAGGRITFVAGEGCFGPLFLPELAPFGEKPIPMTAGL